MLLNCGVGEDSWESLGLQGIQPVHPTSVLGVHWKDWCWSWNSNTLATWCEELTHLKRPWCWERLRAGEEEDDRGWNGWMASPTWWTWVWVDSRSWWWTGKPDVLQFTGSQRVRHDWATELNCLYSVAQLCPTLCDPMDCSLPGPSVHGIFQARILEQIAISYSRGSSRTRDQTHFSCVSCITGGFFTIEPPGKLPS